jgi:hypothetical protein
MTFLINDSALSYILQIATKTFETLSKIILTQAAFDVNLTSMDYQHTCARKDI